MCPARKRALHAEQSVFGPSGPGPLPEHSSAPASHHLHRQAPLSQKRLWPPSAPIVSNWRAHKSHTYLPSSLGNVGPVWPLRKRLLHAEQSVFGPSGPGPLPEHWSPLHSHHLHRQLPLSQKRLWPPSAPIVAKGRPQSGHRYLPASFF